MRVEALLLAVSASVAGCGGTPYRFMFEVEAPGATSAELQICGETTGLTRAGDKFTATRPANCEGEGDITVRFPNRPPVACSVGYVTTGMDQRFRFKLENDRCTADLSVT